MSKGKFFIYVIKTRPKLSRYSRKQENYNATIIFHEKVLPNQLKSLSNLTFSQMFWLFGLFLFTHKVNEVAADCTKKQVTFWF